ncbi:hypothetical protein LZC95_25985 [Pendulispora brunnea]|uniref:Uncharacterized protein n=1 Tax=Pendulispora brunnea TaxID=2905690 RepID=A0ABZ2JTZ3_9BACT
MKEIRSANMDYVLLEGDDGAPLLDVLVGTIAMFPRRVHLTAAEYQRMLSDEAYTREFAISVRREPQKFAGRYQDHPPHAFGSQK